MYTQLFAGCGLIQKEKEKVKELFRCIDGTIDLYVDLKEIYNEEKRKNLYYLVSMSYMYL